MKLVKIYGKEDLRNIDREKLAKLERRIDFKINSEMKKFIVAINKDMTALRVKMNDVEKIMESKLNANKKS